MFIKTEPSRSLRTKFMLFQNGALVLSPKKEFTAAVRECFSRLGELRSLAPQRPLTPVLALTATATLKTQQSVERSLCLRKDCVKIYLSPNRSNIYLYKSRVTTEIDRSFQWLVDKLKSEKTAMGKTIVYCKSIKDCGRLFMFFKSQLGERGYYPEDSPRTSANLLFGMYHHSTLSKQKSIILNSFHEEQGTIRLVFATNALGMGVNFSNVRTIIHYGPPREMEDFVQQIG
ncbi:Werner syndrome ATP-dependent helicase-like [Acropora millepora]|uniref:Werner syndrome ATP-dependent helicase-like n=1 Tax=Acropora millepora TaxID=45264 RepID=UPI001CF4FED5|nr:Werner syndrome ATP-dependent helicase-like [Acropora millepora]